MRCCGYFELHVLLKCMITYHFLCHFCVTGYGSSGNGWSDLYIFYHNLDRGCSTHHCPGIRFFFKLNNLLLKFNCCNQNTFKNCSQIIYNFTIMIFFPLLFFFLVVVTIKNSSLHIPRSK